MRERTLKYFYDPGKFALNFYLNFYLDLTKCIAILKVCYMLREGAVCFFDGNEKMKLKIRRAGADVGAGT